MKNLIHGSLTAEETSKLINESLTYAINELYSDETKVDATEENVSSITHVTQDENKHITDAIILHFDKSEVCEIPFLFTRTVEKGKEPYNNVIQFDSLEELKSEVEKAGLKETWNEMVSMLSLKYPNINNVHYAIE